MGDALQKAMAQVMGLSDEAIRRKMKKPASDDRHTSVDDLSANDTGSSKSLDDMAAEKASGERVSEEGLSDADKARLRELYERMTQE